MLLEEHHRQRDFLSLFMVYLSATSYNNKRILFTSANLAALGNFYLHQQSFHSAPAHDPC